MNPNRCTVRGSVILMAILASACAGNPGSNQQALPTIAVLPSSTPSAEQIAQVSPLPATNLPTATITETTIPTVSVTETPTMRPTDDLEAMSATGEAAVNPLREPLDKFPDFQGLRSLSGLMLDNGVSINIDANVAPADDSDSTMWRVVLLVQQRIEKISQIRVNTYSRDQLNSLWLWENGKWSVTRLATGATEEYSAPPVWIATATAETALTCPKNCAEAVALAWTEKQAGQCSNLDRDGDGVACYGD